MSIMATLYDECMDRALKNVITRMMERSIRREFSEGNYERISHCFRTMKFVQDELGLCIKQYWSITINPKYDNLELLRKFMNQLVNRNSIISKCVYSFEQRSEEKDDYIGIHVHMLAKCTSTSKAQIIQKITQVSNAKQFRDMFEKNSFHVKKCDVSYLDYILGTKTDDKIKKVKNDQLFRQKYDLNSWYVKNMIIDINDEGTPGLVDVPDIYDPNKDI